MKKCPYCLGEVEDQARKCVHCGEWVEPAAAEPAGNFSKMMTGRNLDETLNAGVKWYVQYRIVAAVVGVAIFLIFLFTVFLPQKNKMEQDFNRGPGAPFIQPNGP